MAIKDFTTRELRDALSGFATGVTIVTATNADGEPVGMTASSFNSVSMDPPLVLWSVTKTAHSAPAFQQAKHFAIHVLASNQVDLSNRFAKQGTDKFSGIEARKNANGVPILGKALTVFDCATWAVYEGGDHWIIVGRVEDLSVTKGEGLVFSAGSYATATPLLPAKPATTRPSSPEQAGQSVLDTLLIFHLSHAYRRLSGKVHEAVHAADISIPEWRILASLHNTTGTSMQALSQNTFVELKALPDMLSAMEDKGLCQIDADAVICTAEGNRKVEALFDICQELEGKVFVGTTPQQDAKDLMDLKDALRKITQRI